jgi:hypothetical protein
MKFNLEYTLPFNFSIRYLMKWQNPSQKLIQANFVYMTFLLVKIDFNMTK